MFSQGYSDHDLR